MHLVHRHAVVTAGTSDTKHGVLRTHPLGDSPLGTHELPYHRLNELRLASRRDGRSWTVTNKHAIEGVDRGSGEANLIYNYWSGRASGTSPNLLVYEHAHNTEKGYIMYSDHSLIISLPIQ